MREERASERRELRDLVAHAAGTLKVFPLPGVVVFPGTPTPFHIFEPRYRALVADALDGDRTLCVATLEQAEGATEDRAPVHPIAGAGVIEEDERLPDGRYHVLFRCLTRVRLGAEVENGKPYREFSAELLRDRYPAEGPAALARDIEALVHLTYDLARVLPADSGAADLAATVARLQGPGRIADLVAAAVISEPSLRREVLEALDVGRRMGLVAQELASVLLVLSRGQTPSA
jgi:Lon protease-like protein